MNRIRDRNCWRSWHGSEPVLAPIRVGNAINVSGFNGQLPAHCRRDHTGRGVGRHGDPSHQPSNRPAALQDRGHSGHPDGLPGGGRPLDTPDERPDCVTDASSEAEILAGVRTVLRRHRKSEERSSRDTLEMGRLELDRTRRRVVVSGEVRTLWELASNRWEGTPNEC